MILITYKTHSVGALFIGMLFLGFPFSYILTYFNLYDICIILSLYIVSLYLGSLFPDIDHPKSYLGSKLSIISKFISSKFAHRSFTHSILLIYCLILLFTLIGIILKIFYPYIYSAINIYLFTIECGFVIGCLSHIFFDMFNPSGVCIFYPSTKRYRLPLAPAIKLHSSCEKNLRSFLSFLTYILFIFYLYSFLEFVLIN